MAILNELDEFAVVKVLLYVLGKQDGLELGKQQGQVIKEALKNQVGKKRLKPLNKKLIPFIEQFFKGIIKGITE